ncbi:hypothetical protein CC1G_05989 [Coprinopsis cinerea okayama7|uniref:Uncharacterized protein n=1 Tax=Coprinopsis cinerea (strain Okayama-7 / 130 / ATCC MYA-4618 / FGSC 9003) TaxID=240176 RepID=A8N4L1_COPC7|nr:hypothetical protein CC1G_05989 [Coprinopsis cinerea okayama7\|eukprot:XP_001829780.1 hypothetical protein CC1G_05989 [Coprinopsis cinerea okayama7\
MHVSSTLNAANTADKLPVAIFVYENRRKFLLKEKKYEEALKSVKQAFGLGLNQEIVLKTSTLDVCRDRLVDIDPSAYPHLWSVLDEIVVFTPDQTTKDEPMTPVRVPRVSTVQETTRTSTRTSISGSRVSLARQSARPSTSSRPRPSHTPAPQPPIHEEHMEESADSQDHHGENFTEEAAIADELDAELLEEEGAATGAMEEEEEEEEAPPPAPSRAATEPRTPRATNQEQSTAKRQLAEELFPESPPPPPSKKLHAASSESPVKQERASRAEPSASIRPTSSVASTIDENSRIGVMISGPDGENQSAQFKMRGRHTIQKILKAVCLSFEMDLASSQLYLVREVFDEDDTLVNTELVLCPKNQTAAQCGLYNGAKMVVRSEDDDEDDYEDGY